MKEFNWRLSLVTLVLGLGLIGIWLGSLFPIALATFTRETIVLVRPSDAVLTVTTFIMLLGVALTSIQLAAIIDHVVKGNQH